MLLKKIVYNNFKIFKGEHTFNFANTTLIDGKVGVGKTTAGLEGMLFAVYGYSDKPLAKLCSKGETKYEVTCYIDNLIITRSFPTKITIIEDDKELDFADNNTEAQNYLNSLFKNINYFRKFRLIDVKKGINMLEEGKTSLQKTLFSVHQEIFNIIRKQLLEEKRDREVYNRDNAVVYTHYPSNIRLNILNTSLLELGEESYNLRQESRNIEYEYIELVSKKSKLENSKEYYKDHKNKIIQYSTCPTCKRDMGKECKDIILKEINNSIIELNESLSSVISETTGQSDLSEHFKSLIWNLQDKKDRITNLQLKLDTRLKQKDYKWTTQDILIVKTAIEELDNFCNYYLTEWIKTLEPIINNVIKKIGFTVSFILDEKGDLDILLNKDNYEYSYKELSSGEKLVFSIAFQLALLLERGESGLVIADEGFSSLDEETLTHVVELFKDLPFQLVMMLHRYDNVPEGIHVIKL